MAFDFIFYCVTVKTLYTTIYMKKKKQQQQINKHGGRGEVTIVTVPLRALRNALQIVSICL